MLNEKIRIFQLFVFTIYIFSIHYINKIFIYTLFRLLVFYVTIQKKFYFNIFVTSIFLSIFLSNIQDASNEGKKSNTKVYIIKKR